MTRSDLPNIPDYFKGYINLIDGDFMDAFEKYSIENTFDQLDKMQQLGDKIYAPGKWTVKDTLQHCIDTERVMAYRALCFSRGEEKPLPGFDDALYAQNTLASERTIEDLLEEFKVLRKSTCFMFKYMDKDLILKDGNANGIEISPAALGFMLLGHAVHHNNILKERYFPLLEQ